MTITNGYATLAEARAQVSQTDATYTADDSAIEALVESASRAIDRLTGRRFYANSSDETRYYTSNDTTLFQCPDDIASVTTLATDDTGDYDYSDTWTVSTDFWLEPVNAALDSKPYTQIRAHPTGSYTFPTIVKGVKIVGKFGWYVGSAIEPEIATATLMLTSRLYSRRNTPEGVAGTTSLGTVIMIAKRDPDIMELLRPFMRDMGVAAI